MIRAKGACLRSAQGDAETHAQARDEARRYGEIAVAHLRAAEVRLVLVGGLPGTGKSTVSDAVAGRLGMVLLSSDRLRKELHGISDFTTRSPIPRRNRSSAVPSSAV